ncbi:MULTISPECIES: NAD+ synthase [unclassified Thioalkalivibrio]|uniref:NAD+ synthase n=1 Tax=unclassified Thioalkalivibrio TaxID=2621013 RepID=UPI00037F3B63|nr:MULTISPECIES: NAD+ synthase [unclassified Thioalkalivibrio]
MASTDDLPLALAQINPIVGGLDTNRHLIEDAIEQARAAGARAVVFPELALTGYPPEDLLLRPAFLRAVEQSLAAITRSVAGIDVILGAPVTTEKGLVNAALWLRDGREIARYAKQVLPNYSVFDEQRYFVAGDQACVVELAGWRIGLTVCEDIWQAAPAAAAQAAGAELILNLNASPYHRGKAEERLQVVGARVAETGCPVVYVNQVGGQDELVFDGRSFVHDAAHGARAVLPAWATGYALVQGRRGPSGIELQPRPETMHLSACGIRPTLTDPGPEPDEADARDLYQALMIGIRDYVAKNGFPGVLLGLSGGIDSGLTAALAVDALGPAAVTAVMMPYRYTASMSIEDAEAQARLLGIEYHEIAIEPMVQDFLEGLSPAFDAMPAHAGDVTEENLQSRARGVLLMALSNRSGKLLLATGNKSEMAVGYSTLYGDMNGGFAPLKDVSKQWVYRLARWRNTRGAAIPERVIERPPSAELAPDQKDADSLPPYEVLDAVLEAFVEQERSVEEIVADGFDRATVERIARLVFLAEYKRRQAPPGVRVSRRAFGRDRRYPITSGYRPD